MTSAAADKVIALPKPVLKGSVSVEQALSKRRSIRSFDPAPIALADISQLLWAAQGITDERGFRTVPSAGALYPLEVYLVSGAVSGLESGIYHYDPERHGLRLATAGDVRAKIAKATHGQDWLARAPAILVLAARTNRTAGKYGRRAARYVQMEAGHAGQNVYLQAEARELGTCMVGAFDDASLKELLGLPFDVDPLGLMPIGKRGRAE